MERSSHTEKAGSRIPEPYTMRYCAGDLLIEPQLGQVTRAGHEVPLGKVSFDLLLALVRGAPAFVSVDSLMEQVWSGMVVSPETLTQRVKLLRTALGDDAKVPKYIAGVRGRGYRLIVAVAGFDPAGEAAAAPTPPATTADLGILETSPRRGWMQQVSRQAALGLGGAVVLLLVACAVWYFARGPAPSSASGQVASSNLPAAGAPLVAAPRAMRLAVLPFENLSPDPENEFFADGLHEEILSRLAQVAPHLEVISRTTMMTYRGGSKTLSELALELHATHVMEGSIRREAGRVRLTLQLIDARTDDHVWSQNYERTFADVLTLESEVARDVASQLSERLTEDNSSQRPLTSDPEAYDLYLKALLAREAVSTKSPPEALSEVDSLLSRAIARDPHFARAYAQRAGFGLFAFIFSFDTSAEKLQRIRTDLETARRLAPDDVDVLAAGGAYMSHVEQDGERAIALFEEARHAGLADVLFQVSEADTLARMGRFEEAKREFDRVIGIDPANKALIGWISGFEFNTRQPEDALRALDRGTLYSNQPDYWLPWRALIVRYYTGNGSDGEPDLCALGSKDCSGATARMDAPSSAQGLRSYTDLEWLSLLRMQHRYRDIEQQVGIHSNEGVRSPYVGLLPVYAIGERPLAEVLGWVDLLLGDSAGAAERGAQVLAFASRSRETAFNGWFLQAMRAAGYTFLRQPKRAIGAAELSLALAAKSPDVFTRAAAASLASEVYAWSGAQDEAVAVLERLATSVPGLPPAAITRDPIYAVPLARNLRYQALVAGLEAQMKATHLH